MDDGLPVDAREILVDAVDELVVAPVRGRREDAG
jgi:hypothetical protein